MHQPAGRPLKRGTWERLVSGKEIGARVGGQHGQEPPRTDEEIHPAGQRALWRAQQKPGCARVVHCLEFIIARKRAASGGYYCAFDAEIAPFGFFASTQSQLASDSSTQVLSILANVIQQQTIRIGRRLGERHAGFRGHECRLSALARSRASGITGCEWRRHSGWCTCYGARLIWPCGLPFVTCLRS